VKDENWSRAPASGVDSGYAWVRLAATLALGTIGGVGMWSVVVVLPAVQESFAISRAEASLSYSLAMTGFGVGGILMGRLVDSLGVFRPLLMGICIICLGYLGTAFAETHWQFALAYGLLIAMLGCSMSFGPLIADASLWFDRRRGIAVAVAASGNYMAGTVWPPILQRLTEAYGWRMTHVIVAFVCLVTMLPLALLLRHPAPITSTASASDLPATLRRPTLPAPFSPAVLQGLLIVAGITCCLAMAMPQVHIVAYCGDLGYGPARGAEMLSLMFGFGIVSRLMSGAVADRIGGLNTLLLGSFLQMVALALYVPFDGLMSLYVISALFGLFQGGIIPSYAILVREWYPPEQVGTRVGITLTATMIGMALGGWMTGAIFDLAGSYRIAFLNGIFWNLVNLAIVLLLIWRTRQLQGHSTRAVAQPAE
jgi:MFS family permease